MNSLLVGPQSDTMSQNNEKERKETRNKVEWSGVEGATGAL